jgi:pyruvate/2-oxoglutarate dehydrogenase complex dihydrolipoamide acyltransferase (E2) component
MEVPSPSAGVTKKLEVAVGRRVSQGALWMIIAEQKTTDDRPARSSIPAPAQIAAAIPERRSLSVGPPRKIHRSLRVRLRTPRLKTRMRHRRLELHSVSWASI